ncbi:hypothetical protein F4859DRAFT_517034 [Xylaria cf. heliscus]|nr:hypothetical protein F4859DRAFT_517034 [Xylaria cf. heliscus]
MSHSNNFDPGHAIQALLDRVLADGKQHDLSISLVEVAQNNALTGLILRQEMKFQTHEAVVYSICTTVWFEIFGDMPPWPMEPRLANHGIVGLGNMNMAMQPGAIFLITTLAIRYPVEALKLLEHKDSVYIRNSVIEQLASVDLSNASEDYGKCYDFDTICDRSRANSSVTVAYHHDMQEIVAAVDISPPNIFQEILRSVMGGVFLPWIAVIILLFFFIFG